MPLATIFATNQTGTINNMSGIYFADTNGTFWSNTSSSSNTMESEAHVFFDTTDANTGIPVGATINSFKLYLNITEYTNPNPGVNLWLCSWGTGAGASLDSSDWRVDYGLNPSPVSGGFDSGGVVSNYEIELTGTFLRSNAFHALINAIAYDFPVMNIAMSYVTGVTPRMVIDYTLVSQSVSSKNNSKSKRIMACDSHRQIKTFPKRDTVSISRGIKIISRVKK